MEPNQFKTSLEIPITYIQSNQGKDKPLVVVFHGFADSAKSALKRVYPVVNEQFEVLAMNGPFPVPQYRDGEWKHAFAWYFADFSNTSVYIHPNVAAGALNELLNHLNLQDRPKFVVGFSQGAFFIPFALKYLKNVRHFVGVGAAYRQEDYEAPLSVPMDALHGSEDKVVDFKRARSTFAEFKDKKNNNGEFLEFEGMSHTLNDDGRNWLKNKIDLVLTKEI